jgi:hypothetical protein
LFPDGFVGRSASSRTAGLPGLQRGGEAVAAASAHHHHNRAERASLMAGWHHESTNTNTPGPRRLRELLAEWWRRIRRS